MDINKLGLDASLIEATRAIVEKNLHPNQEKLDKNKNGKLDKDDFKILRGEKSVKEEVEELDEVSDATVKSLIQKRQANANKAMDRAAIPRQTPASSERTEKEADVAVAKRNKAYDAAAARLKRKFNEEIEQIDELSKATLGSYVKKAKPEIAAHSQDADYARQIGDKKNADDSRRKEFNREKGVNVARAKLGRKHDSSYYAGKIKVKANEELTKEQYDEIEALAAKHGLTGE
jgi:hypothetical protein